MLDFHGKGADFKRGLLGDVQDMVGRMLSNVNATVAAQANGAVVSDQHRILNFLGTGVSVTDDPLNRRTNISIAGNPLTGTATVIVSSTAAKALSLWNGSSNNAPPASWETTGFSDAGWSNAVAGANLGHGTSPIVLPSTAAAIWATATAASVSEQCLIRQTFALPAGTITAATLQVNVDDYSPGLYVNGTLVWSRASSPPTSPVDTISLSPSVLASGTNNLIAMYGANQFQFPGGFWAFVTYRLDVTYSTAGFLSADLANPVAISASAGVYADGPSLAVTPGTWLLISDVTVSVGADLKTATAKLWDGTTVTCSTEATVRGAAGRVSMTLSGFVSPTANTTYKTSVAVDGSASTILASAVAAGTPPNASGIRAIRVA